MNVSNKPAYLAFALVIAEVIAVLLPVIILGMYFRFPDILREPASVALPLFHKNQGAIVPAYYVFMVSGLLFVPLSYSLAAVLLNNPPVFSLSLLKGLGITTAVFQALGFSRWVFVVPYLSEQYRLTPENRPAISLLYEVLNRYLGMTVGEHLGFLSMGGWMLVLSTLLWRENRFGKRLAITGLLIGILLILSIAEHFGGAGAAFFGTLNFIANTAWSLWMLLLGVFVLMRKNKPPIFAS